VRARLGLLFLGLALVAGPSCTRASSPSGPPQRSCGVTVWFKPASDLAHLEIVGDFNGYTRPGLEMAAQRDGWRALALDLSPGEHTYAIVVDGVWLTDPNVPTTGFVTVDGRSQEVTWVDVASCEAPALEVTRADATEDGHATVEARLLASRGADPLDPASVTATARDGRTMIATRADPTTGAMAFAADGLPAGKHAFTLRAQDRAGRAADEAVATVWVEPRGRPEHAGRDDLVVYQIIVDRFRGDDGAALAPPAMPSGRAGGSVRGVRAAIERGDLDALGVNAVWLSPLYAQPSGTFPGADGRPYTAYHGYWPSDARGLEPAMGTEADIDALVAAAHGHGIRVLFDVVPNHVHREHPYYRTHGDWFDHGCVCGAPGCDWGAHIEECWFTPYLPDVDWTNADAARQMTSDVRWWLDRFDGDGVRIDAVPMMPRAATRRIVQAIRSRYDHPGHASLLLGENYTGPGGYAQLRYELGPFGLDSEFDFPLMWALRGAVARGDAPMSDIDDAVHAGDAAWAGSGAIMATMIGNHDVTRFASEAAGDAAGDTWISAAQPTDPRVYAKQALALATVMTLPGIPVLYYGDEVALPGRGDPDSRRVMPGDAALTDAQKALRETARRLGQARSCSDALRRGSYRALVARDEALVFARELPGSEPAVVVLTRTPTTDLSVPLPGIAAGTYIDLLTGAQASLSPELTNVGGAPFSVRVLVPSTSRCAQR
jgi:glycosidase